MEKEIEKGERKMSEGSKPEVIDALLGQVVYSSIVGAIVAFYLSTVSKKVREAFRKSINEICDNLNKEEEKGDDIGGIGISIEEVEDKKNCRKSRRR